MKLLKAKLRALVLIFTGLLTVLCIVFSLQTFGGGEKVVIGAKNCTEQHILAEILSQLIERKTHLRVIRKFNLEGTTICFNALRSKTIDIYVEYTGTAVLDILKESIPDCPLYEYVSRVFDKKFGILWLNRLGFSNQYVLIAHRDLGATKLSDLANYAQLCIAYDPEFSARLEAKILEEAYGGIRYKHLMDQVLLYFSLGNKAVDVISGFSTDGRLADSLYSVLEDDRHCLPSYEAAPIVTRGYMEKHPELLPVFDLLADTITTREMSLLNYKVEIEGRDICDVATEWLNHFGMML